MSGKKFALVCFVLLFVISLSKSQQSFTNRNDNLTMRYEIITFRHNLHKNLMNNTQNDKMQHEFHMNNKREDNDLIQHKRYKHSMQNKDDEQKSIKSNTNLTNVNHKRNFTPQEVYENVIEKNDSMSLEVLKNFSKDANRTNIVPNEMCYNDTCIRLCCSLGDRLFDECIPEEIEYIFPKVYTNDSTQSEKRINELFNLAIYDSCQDNHVLLFEGFQYDYKIFTNGSIYLPYYKIFVESTSYCLAVVDGNEFEVTICSKTYDKIKEIIDNEPLSSDDIMELSAYILSILPLGLVFLVYSILPELRNVQGFMLRNYSGALFVAYGFDTVDFFINSNDVQYPVCVTIAFIRYFCFLAGFFWLNIISFDMWCTFRGFSSLRRNVTRENRKLIYYTIFAWGCPFMLAFLCVSMDILSAYVNVPPILRPEFHLGDCWFNENGPYYLYYYGLENMCIISSICLFIFTALKIERLKKDTGHRLNDSESKCYNNNKKWFNLYLQLFIVRFMVIGIEWLIIAVGELTKNQSIYYWYVIHLLDFMQSLCVFIIFVCKKRIKRMLFKRFGCGL
ncbi:probable G-protein coupled receptor Mth-like 3 [Nylanderia fulva]|uniref:probable G-protein coupled receptor Mth-like 3 n=1 Tax=Nylanderia fulva TaxID=613905 RepID=UPI0010FB8CE5|nr:probable G-protein coupled receptor Mth-like 3 [Nylanderia fulva]